MTNLELDSTVAWITGAANGIGAATARRLAEAGVRVLVADVDDAAGESLAEEIGGHYVHCDVREPDANTAAVAAAVEQFGGLDLAFLNAGISTGFGLGEDFDVDGYRRAMAINLDGVVFGMQAALPVMTARGGGTIVATASMAGLTMIPQDPIYAANKTAVVGLVRSVALAQQQAGVDIKVQALCPSFAQTAIIGPIESFLNEMKFPILPVSEVVDTFMSLIASDGTGECWFVVPGRESAPFGFRNVPGPRS